MKSRPMWFYPIWLLIYQPTEELTLRISGGIEKQDDRGDNYTTRNFFNSPGRASVEYRGSLEGLLSEKYP